MGRGCVTEGDLWRLGGLCDQIWGFFFVFDCAVCSVLFADDCFDSATSASLELLLVILLFTQNTCKSDSQVVLFYTEPQSHPASKPSRYHTTRAAPPPAQATARAPWATGPCPGSTLASSPPPPPPP